MDILNTFRRLISKFGEANVRGPSLLLSPALSLLLSLWYFGVCSCLRACDKIRFRALGLCLSPYADTESHHSVQSVSLASQTYHGIIFLSFSFVGRRKLSCHTDKILYIIPSHSLRKGSSKPAPPASHIHSHCGLTQPVFNCVCTLLHTVEIAKWFKI